jgi:hypothetical protein
VFYGPEEREIANFPPTLSAYYPDVEEIYASGQVRIYKVKY